MNGEQIIGSVDGKQLATITNNSGTKGMAFLASTYDRNLFDNVHVARLSAEGKPGSDPK